MLHKPSIQQCQTKSTPNKNRNEFSANVNPKNIKKNNNSKFLVLLPLVDSTNNKEQENSTTNSRLRENKQSPLRFYP